MKLNTSPPIHAFLNAIALTLALTFIASSADGLSVLKLSDSRSLEMKTPVLATSVIDNG